MKKAVVALLFGILFSTPAMAQLLLQPVPGSLIEAKMFWFPYVVAGGGYEFDVVVQNTSNIDVMFRLKLFNGLCPPEACQKTGNELLLDAHLTDGRVLTSGTSFFTTIVKGRSGYIRFTSPSLVPQTGFMRVEVARTASRNPGADFSLTFRRKQDGVTVTEATVPVVEGPASGFSVFGMKNLDQGDQVETGMVLTNPNDISVVVDAIWRDSTTGAMLGREVGTLSPRSSESRFISEILPIGALFEETITFQTRDGLPIFATALKSSGRNKDIISTIPLGAPRSPR